MSERREEAHPQLRCLDPLLAELLVVLVEVLLHLLDLLLRLLHQLQTKFTIALLLCCLGGMSFLLHLLS